MESPPMQRRYPIVERPLSPRDYDLPIGWWGWNWEPPVPMSIIQILQAGNMDARTAALCGMAMQSHGSLLIAAEQPHSGKTTTLTALLDFLPNVTRRIFIRGWAETFDFLGQTNPATTLLLANELSSHLPVYLWGPKAVRVFETLRRGYALASTLHADSCDEALAQLVGELGVERTDLARVHLLAVMRIYATAGGGYARRVVSVHRLMRRDRTVAALPLIVHDERADSHDHDEEAELDLLLALRPDQERAALDSELDRCTDLLGDLLRRGRRAIPDVRAALASYRGEPILDDIRGDPVQ
ncbi:MAG TPA: hypothetical protein VGQ86_03415 [Candidatus Limnocylindria bacterium]|jgi:hypothetical protein|nr:hypothetical protein [Candidatus Limnocylindria bacterium]